MTCRAGTEKVRSGGFARGSVNLEKRRCRLVSPLQAPPTLSYGGLTHAAPGATNFIQIRFSLHYDHSLVEKFIYGT